NPRDPIVEISRGEAFTRVAPLGYSWVDFRTAATVPEDGPMNTPRRPHWTRPWPALLLLTLATSAARGADLPQEIPDADREALAKRLDVAGDRANVWIEAIQEAPPNQREAVAFLVAHMPEPDLKTLDKEYLLKNVRLAHEAREATSWARDVPKALFFEQVLPYASINERRDDWRADFLERFLPLVKSAATAQQAVEILNVEVFKTLNVKYHPTKRPKPDQSPYESIEAGFASCTGLSVLLIDACRAVGLPARFVGTPRWTTVRGNHSWVEVFTDCWRFVGACEPSQLDQTWFLDNASKADESNPVHRIYATSYKTTGTHFPLIWERSLTWVQAVDVTRSYTKRRPVNFKRESGQADGVILTLRRDGAIVGHKAFDDDGEVELDLATDLTYEVILGADDGRTVSRREVTIPSEPKPVVTLK
ncbi:MAG: transglutaminase-like domain-containing protein, partial [Isosphaeraceae bacterium]